MNRDNFRKGFYYITPTYSVGEWRFSQSPLRRAQQPVKTAAEEWTGSRNILEHLPQSAGIIGPAEEN
jgi:hypothetical protein